jgi:nitrate reductase gamma subunit
MPVFVVIALVLVAFLFRRTGIPRTVATSLLKSALAVFVILAAIILGVMALSSIQIP